MRLFRNCLNGLPKSFPAGFRFLTLFLLSSFPDQTFRTHPVSMQIHENVWQIRLGIAMGDIIRQANQHLKT